MLNEVGLYFIEGNSDFCATGFGDQAVPKVPKPGSVLFQVDENRNFPAFAVRDELYSSHRLIFSYRSSICYRIEPLTDKGWRRKRARRNPSQRKPCWLHNIQGTFGAKATTRVVHRCSVSP